MKARETKLRAALREVAPPPTRSAQDFWEDFRARAELVHQAKPVRHVTPAGRWLFALGAAAAVILVVFSVSRLLSDPVGDKQAPRIASLPKGQGGVSGPLSQIEEMQVFVDDASVMVFEDTENGGTVVFVEASPPPNHT